MLFTGKQISKKFKQKRTLVCYTYIMTQALEQFFGNFFIRNKNYMTTSSFYRVCISTDFSTLPGATKLPHI